MNGNNEHKERRARVQLSCQPCRVGKLKCNRQLPCDQCMKRSKEPTCVYTRSARESMSYKMQADAMRKKLENMERTLQAIKAANPAVAAPTPSFQSQTTYPTPSGSSVGPTPTSLEGTPAGVPTNASTGQMNLTNDNETFIAPFSWESVLDDISEVKAFLDAETATGSADSLGPSDEVSPSASDSLLSSTIAHSMTPVPENKELLIQSVPNKPDADKLIAAWFASMDPYKGLIHVPSFQKQYTRLWTDPTSLPIMWFALLFDVLALGAQYLHQDNHTFSPSTSANIYLDLAAQAILMRYTICPPNTLEALLLYVRSCQLQHSDRRLKEWLALGIATRLSQRMGYHREPNWNPGMSHFDAEMRRRTWLYLCKLDLQSSYELGLNSVIGKLNWTFITPSNYHDSDLDPSMNLLPPPRSLAEVTGVTAIIVMGQILPLFASALELPHTATYEDVARLDQALQQARDEIPLPLKIRPFDQSFADSPGLIMDRIRLEHFCQNTRCILYRRYLGSAQTSGRRLCVDAALVSLGLQKSLWEARRSDGPLASVNPLLILDIIDCVMLASIIVGLELNASRSTAGQPIYSNEERLNMVQALEVSCSIWTVSLIASPKTRRTAKALEKVVRTEQSIHDMAINQGPVEMNMGTDDLNPQISGDVGMDNTDTADISNQESMDLGFGFSLDNISSIDWTNWDANFPTFETS